MSARERKRRRLNLVIGAVLFGGLVNVLFFAMLYRPARSEYLRLLDSVSRLRQEAAFRERSAAGLEVLESKLERSDRDRSRMLETRFLQRSTGFSKILPELDEAASLAGVQKSRVDYSIEDQPNRGLYAVKIRIPVQGSYSNIVNFIRALESSGRFFILESIEVRNVAQSGDSLEGAPIALGLELSTFFTN